MNQKMLATSHQMDVMTRWWSMAHSLSASVALGIGECLTTPDILRKRGMMSLYFLPRVAEQSFAYIVLSGNIICFPNFVNLVNE